MKVLLLVLSATFFSLPTQANCIERFANALEINMDMQTKPELIRDILINDMYLIGQVDVQRSLGALLTQSVSLTPMLNTIANAIRIKHPTLNLFLCQAVESGLLPQITEEVKMMIEKTIHHTFLLEKITLLMRENRGVMTRIKQHVLATREMFKMGSLAGIYAVSRDLFMPAKMMSMDIAMNRFQRVRNLNEFSWAQVQQTRLGLRVNILEAIATDVSHDFLDNAYIGGVLAADMPENVYVTGEDRVLVYEISQAWMTFYEAWNLAFITGNLTNLNLLYPKLIMPSVIDANPNDYIFNRGLSLWLTSNFYLFSKAKGVDEPLANGVELAKILARITRAAL